MLRKKLLIQSLFILLLIVGCVFAENNSKIYLANDIIIQCDSIQDHTNLNINLRFGDNPHLSPIAIGLRKIGGYNCYDIKSQDLTSLDSMGLVIDIDNNNEFNYENKIDVGIDLIEIVIFEDGSSISIEEIKKHNKLWGIGAFTLFLGSIVTVIILL